MRRVAALIFDGFELLDLYGPLQMLGVCEDRFSLTLVAERPDPVASAQGVRACPDATMDAGTGYDLLLVPGGMGTRRAVGNPAVLDWLRAVAAEPRAEMVLSVCTASLLLAGAGLLDGRRATTNKAAFAGIAARYPKVDWVRQARWVEDGRFITASGVSAGMDMTLRAIALMLGEDTADEVAVICEYQRQHDSARDPFAQVHGLL